MNADGRLFNGRRAFLILSQQPPEHLSILVISFYRVSVSLWDDGQLNVFLNRIFSED